MQLLYTPLPEFHGSAVVGKKVYKKAVDRNKLRRRIYSVLYQKYRAEDLTGVYIVVAKPQAAGAAFTAISSEIQSLIDKVQPRVVTNKTLE